MNSRAATYAMAINLSVYLTLLRRVGVRAAVVYDVPACDVFGG